MIIKSKTRTKCTAKQLANYILTDKGKIENPYKTFVLLQNINTVDINRIHKEFLANDKYRKKRKGGIALYHDQLSIHPKDKEHVTDNMLEDLLKKYVELRGAKNALVVAKAHMHADNPHLHVMISGNEVKSSKTLRMSMNQFETLRRKFEQYQVQQYPELTHSIAYVNKNRKLRDRASEDRNTRREKEYQYQHRTGKTTTKAELAKRLQNIFSSTLSVQQSLWMLSEVKDLQFYRYRKQVVGVIHRNRKYRFITLGISTQVVERIQKLEQRQKELKMIFVEHDKVRFRSKRNAQQLRLGI